MVLEDVFDRYPHELTCPPGDPSTGKLRAATGDRLCAGVFLVQWSARGPLCDNVSPGRKAARRSPLLSIGSRIEPNLALLFPRERRSGGRQIRL